MFMKLIDFDEHASYDFVFAVFFKYFSNTNKYKKKSQTFKFI